jgi:hypothetical protein
VETFFEKYEGEAIPYFVVVLGDISLRCCHCVFEDEERRVWEGLQISKMML